MPAETGLPGIILFSAIMYLSVKIPLVALRRYDARPDARPAKTWSMALLAMICGLLVGAFFLSFTYHFVLWIHLGFSGAFFSVMQRKDPGFTVRASPGELAAITVLPLLGLAIYVVQIVRMGCW